MLNLPHSPMLESRGTVTRTNDTQSCKFRGLETEDADPRGLFDDI